MKAIDPDYIKPLLFFGLVIYVAWIIVKKRLGDPE